MNATSALILELTSPGHGLLDGGPTASAIGLKEFQGISTQPIETTETGEALNQPEVDIHWIAREAAGSLPANQE
ncbi:MAG TPA: hypothetical protein VFN23_06210 [Ktedonobacteraceae bacterium]|nr:hypothetical protein [Ktedonobacteraceae bacterium]